MVDNGNGGHGNGESFSSTEANKICLINSKEMKLTNSRLLGETAKAALINVSKKRKDEQYRKMNIDKLVAIILMYKKVVFNKIKKEKTANQCTINRPQIILITMQHV